MPDFEEFSVGLVFKDVESSMTKIGSGRGGTVGSRWLSRGPTDFYSSYYFKITLLPLPIIVSQIQLPSSPVFRKALCWALSYSLYRPMSRMLTTCSPVPVLGTISLQTILSTQCILVMCQAVCSGLQLASRICSRGVRRVACNWMQPKLNWYGLVLVPLFVIHQFAGPSKSGLLLYHLLMSF